ncbi:OmpA family protein [Fulvivirgaceae bacterium PWU20]|uniref:OmpA family protein n=2 Tax=Chryseosolibacter indicus TaxID=2782351 RepID=A0ABS5W026_9BACT|nr:OmpA family protein [Chryseosolibacter indicus]MBT1706462.1 OmpA family protein [Chryseosolibacter indicus]
MVQLNDSVTSYSQSDIFDFPNINKIKLYSDVDKLKRIKQLQLSAAEKELYKELRTYVYNFGIENFAQQTELLWQLAKLSEKYGQQGEAILLYRLILKHNRQNIDIRKVRREYDTLSQNERDYYVPLKEYYELVAYRKEIDTLRPPQGVLLRMADWINSTKADYAPTIGNLDSVLLFTSKRNSHHQNVLEKTYNEDLFFTIRQYGQWNEAQAFKTINTQYNEGSACLSRDGKKLYFARCNSPDSHGNCDLFQAELKQDSTWGNVQNLGLLVNSTAWDSHPSLSHSGDTLFFASDRIGGFGMSDIYYTVKDLEGKWQKAVNAGPIVNTRGSEVSPFFHHRFNVLYFSSNGQPVTFGDFDIYKAYNNLGKWEEPKNIGPLVNGPGSEYYFTIDSQSNTLYYARSEAEDIDNLDLHSFPVPMEAQPEAIVNLKGSLVDSNTKKPFKGIVSVIDLDEGVEVAPKFLRPDGSFDFKLINKRNYLLIIQGDDFFRIEELFFMDGDMEMNRETEPIESKIAFQSLEFENGKADILPSMHSDLDKLANFLIDHPRLKLNISGHTDRQGSEDSNLRLSQARADAIRAYLMYMFKIDPDRIEAQGFGSSKPLIEEHTDEDRKLNRRVEFNITKN